MDPQNPLKRAISPEIQWSQSQQHVSTAAAALNADNDHKRVKVSDAVSLAVENGQQKQRSQSPVRQQSPVRDQTPAVQRSQSPVREPVRDQSPVRPAVAQQLSKDVEMFTHDNGHTVAPVQALAHAAVPQQLVQAPASTAGAQQQAPAPAAKAAEPSVKVGKYEMQNPESAATAIQRAPQAHAVSQQPAHVAQQSAHATAQSQQQQMETKPTVNTNTSLTEEQQKALTKAQMSWAATNLRNLKRHGEIHPFMHPVDPVALNIPQYFDIVKHPMDLSTVDKKLHAGEYTHVQQYIDDVQQMLNNCFTFNPPNHQVYLMGKNVEKSFLAAKRKMPTTLEQLDSPRGKAKKLLENDEDRRKSIRRTEDAKFMFNVHKELMKNTHQPFMWPFYEPVDPVKLGIPQYFDVVKQPMDMSTIGKKLDADKYATFEEFESDFRLMINNCKAFNQPGDDVYAMGERAEQLYEHTVLSRGAAGAKLPASVFTQRVQSASSQPGKKRKSFTNDQSGDSSTDDDDLQIKALESQILFLQSQVAMMRKSRRKKGKGKGKRRSSVTHHSPVMSNEQQQLPKPPKAAKPPKQPREKKQQQKKSEEIRKFTFEEKRELSDEINNLDGDKLGVVVQIIHEGMPQLANADGQEEIELDIEQLDDNTLNRLWNFVKGKRRKKNRPAVTSTDPVTAANRIKELSEQIAMMDGRMDKTKKHDQPAVASVAAAVDSATGSIVNSGMGAATGSKGVPPVMSGGHHSSTEDSDESGGSESDLE